MNDSLSEFLFRVRDHDVPLFGRMFHDVMGTDNPIDVPAVLGQFFNKVFAVHGVYHTHVTGVTQKGSLS